MSIRTRHGKWPMCAYSSNGDVDEAWGQSVISIAGTNCRNCGAPPEPVCSYCGTKAATSPGPGLPMLSCSTGVGAGWI